MHLEELVIVDYVDGALDATARADADRHLGQCAACRELIADFEEIRGAARTLDARQPPARAWQRIERAIAVDAGAPAGAGRPSTSRRAAMVWIAVAATLVVATAAGIQYGARSRSAAPAAQVDAAAQPSAAAIEAELRAAESHYDKAIRGLEQIASAEQSALDPNTAATLQKNLAVIDQAISESRAAVVSQPASEPARESLMESFRTKLALLQDTVALINEMRKGNEAGAARVVSGLKQKGD